MLRPPSLVALTLALGACGGDDSSADSKSADASDTEGPESGSSSSGEPSDDESGGGESGGAPVADNPCWTRKLTSTATPSVVLPLADALLTVSDDGLRLSLSGDAGEWTQIAEFDAPGVPSSVAGALDNLWFVASSTLYRWDGESVLEYPLSGDALYAAVSNDPGGGSWLTYRDCAADCSQRFFSLEAPQEWSPLPQLSQGLWTRAMFLEHERWAVRGLQSSDAEVFHHQDGDPDWLLVDSWSTDYEAVATAGPSGLWLLDPHGCYLGSPSELRHLAGPDDSWHIASLPDLGGQSSCQYELAEIDGQLYILDEGQTMLWRWDGSAPQPELVLKIPPLPGPGSMRLFSSAGRGVLLTERDGPQLDELLTTPTVHLETRLNPKNVESTAMSAQDLDLVFAMDNRTAYSLARAGGPLHTLPDWTIERRFSSGSPRGLWADSPTSAYFIQHGEVPPNSLDRSRVWYLREAAAPALLTTFPANEYAELIWGRPSGDVWIYGVDYASGPGKLFARRYDGQTWSKETLDAPHVGDLRALTGDGERRYLLDENGDVHVHGDNSWFALPPSSADSVSEGELVFAGGELFMRARQDFDGVAAPERSFEVWDGDLWQFVAQRWPDAPADATHITADGAGGLWALTPAPPNPSPPAENPIDPSASTRSILYYFHGGQWQLVDSPEPLGVGSIAATAQGLLLNEASISGRHTRMFRWSCE